MPFEARIRELSDLLASCDDDAQALELAQELRGVLHERIEQLREKLAGLPLMISRPKRRNAGG